MGLPRYRRLRRLVGGRPLKAGPGGRSDDLARPVHLGFLPGRGHPLVEVLPPPILGVFDVGEDVSGPDDRKVHPQQGLPPPVQDSKTHRAQHQQEESPRQRIVQYAEVVPQLLVVQFGAQQEQAEERQVGTEDDLGGVRKDFSEESKGKVEDLPDDCQTGGHDRHPSQTARDFLEGPQGIPGALVAIPRVGPKLCVAAHVRQVGSIAVGKVLWRQHHAGISFVHQEGRGQSVVLGRLRRQARSDIGIVDRLVGIFFRRCGSGSRGLLITVMTHLLSGVGWFVWKDCFERRIRDRRFRIKSWTVTECWSGAKLKSDDNVGFLENSGFGDVEVHDSRRAEENNYRSTEDRVAQFEVGSFQVDMFVFDISLMEI